MKPLPVGVRRGEFFARVGLLTPAACLTSGVFLASAPPAAAQTRAGDVVVESRYLPIAGGDSVAVDVGRLFVPENRAKPDSRLIELAFVRVRSTAADPGPPLLYLAGGPGGSATAQVDAGPLRFVPIVGYDPQVTHPSVPRP